MLASVTPLISIVMIYDIWIWWSWIEILKCLRCQRFHKNSQTMSCHGQWPLVTVVMVMAMVSIGKVPCSEWQSYLMSCSEQLKRYHVLLETLKDVGVQRRFRGGCRCNMPKPQTKCWRLKNVTKLSVTPQFWRKATKITAVAQCKWIATQNTFQSRTMAKQR